MSKTDKTRPYWVKVTETPMGTCVPIHKHTDPTLGCTLPPDPADGLQRESTRCYWAPSTAFGSSGAARCGCPMCTQQVERRIQRRRDRHTTRRFCTETRATFRHGYTDDHDLDL